uniref:Serine/threonine-protein kinase RIO1 n=1 Tax=Cyprinus carpio TaxID=7962 RepID=A0A8C2DP09_CYPCA
MYQVVPGQFDDADETRSEAEISQVPDKPSLENRLHEVTLQTCENEEDYDDYDYDYEDEDEDDEWDWNEAGGGDFTKRYTALRTGNNPQANRQNSNKSLKMSTPSDKVLRKFENKINLDRLSYADSVINKVTVMQKQREADTFRVKDKSDRATVEQVLDPRTRMILFKMLSRGVFSEINGCISTGKETTDRTDSESRMTCTWPFTSTIYTCTNTSQQLIKTWECFRVFNKFLNDTPDFLSFDLIGVFPRPAPLLKNAVLSESKSRELYLQVIQNMRIMYNEAHLVHADLSEFNILYHNGDAYFIDVSQSVEHDHPHALEFLRKDCSNVNDFFQKHDVAVMTVRELFEFITDPSITSDNINEYLDKAMEIASERTAEDRSNQDKVNDEVFKKAYIPRTLNEVTHYERDVDTMLKKTEEILYQTVTGLRKDLSGVQMVPLILEDSTKDDSSSSEGEEEDEDDEEKSEGEGEIGISVFQERKKLVKEAQREKRKNKMPKYVKKRKEKVAKMKKGK